MSDLVNAAVQLMNKQYGIKPKPVTPTPAPKPDESAVVAEVPAK